MDPIAMANEFFKIDQEELRIWRESYPRQAANVREEARAKVECREPRFGSPHAFGALE